MEYIEQLKKIYNDLLDFSYKKIPLCAAETYVSSFVKQGLSSEFEGKYIQGYKNRIIEKDNIGSNKIFPLLCLVEDICKDLYNANYVDSRTLSGMNCMSILVMSLINKSSTVIITTKDAGGHPSLASILDNLGIKYLPMPYDYRNYQIDYAALNKLMKDEKDLSFIIFCQSDILIPPDLDLIDLPDNVGVIYDASQTLGLIASNVHNNPLNYKNNNMILIGGTHKTLPGPTCGLIMTNNKDHADKIDFIISPTLLRNIQPNNIMALCLSLIEQKETGVEYQQKIVNNANTLGKYLNELGIDVVQPIKNTYSQTHQLFIKFNENDVDRIYRNALHYNITLNKRISQLYTGIRIGVQEITRYNYSDKDLRRIAELLYLISLDKLDDTKIRDLCADLRQQKIPHYILNDIFTV